MVQRHDLTKQAWAVLKPLLPAESNGRPWRSHRQVINGILWVLAAGCSWRDAPARYGPWKTLHDRFNRWRADGTWDRLLAPLLEEMNRRGQIDWELWCVDGTSIRALKAAAGARNKTGGGRTHEPCPGAFPRWIRLEDPPAVR